MFPGLTTKVSIDSAFAWSTTIEPVTDVIAVTSTTATTVCSTIRPAFGGFSGILIVINKSGNNMTTVTTGNIATAVTIGQNVATLLVYRHSEDKWYPGALA